MTKAIRISILGFGLTAILFSVSSHVLPSSIIIVYAQENTTSLAEPVTPAGNTSLTSQPENTSITTVSIVKGSADPKNERFYIPKVANITVGATVKWTNDDPIPHTVTSGTPEGPTKEFDSGFIKSGDSFIHTFNNTGLVEYFCLPHPWMTGTVRVS